LEVTKDAATAGIVGIRGTDSRSRSLDDSSGAAGDTRGRRARLGRTAVRDQIAGRLSSRARQAFLPMSVVEPPVETVLHDPPGGGAGLDNVLSTIQDLGLRVLSIHEIPS
jgi:hypothetical protein